MPKCTILLTYCCLHAVEYSPDVASTLDRINLSDRKIVLLTAAIAKANDDLSTAPCHIPLSIANIHLIDQQLLQMFAKIYVD